MINVRTEPSGDKINFIFDDGFSIEKSIKPSGCAIAVSPDISLEIAYQTAKKYREAIRDWMYTRYGESFRRKEAIFYPLFRLTNSSRFA